MVDSKGTLHVDIYPPEEGKERMEEFVEVLQAKLKEVCIFCPGSIDQNSMPWLHLTVRNARNLIYLFAQKEREIDFLNV